nr:hypothetical protein Iba_chr13cCG12880 [Ipomoea batatas]
MEQDPTKFFNFSKLTNKYPNDIQHQASGVMMFIINNKMDPPGGEPIWSFYSREDKLDYLKGFLKPLAMETSESSLEKAHAPDEIPEDEEYEVLLSQIGRPKEKEKGKRKQLKLNEAPSLTRKSKRKQPAPKRIEIAPSYQKGRKKNTMEAPSPSTDEQSMVSSNS